jgi:aspartyl-tRNA(Asn)/glutamyl-tRNA(Gln) amidotransferase subunit A
LSAGIQNLSLVEIADELRQGSVTSLAVTEIALERLSRLGKTYNCTMTIEAEAALERAKALDGWRRKGGALGPLHGVPLAHKDLFYRAGRKVTLGSPIHKDVVAKTTATVLRRLDDAGAVDAGSLQLSEFAYSATGYNKYFGHCRNPWNIDYVPGGSSSGSAAAVAGRLVYGSLGTDSGGSARHPAALCGVTGLKPTQTRVSRAGVGPLSFSLDCVSPLARTARDCARLLSVVAGSDPSDATSSTQAAGDYERELTGDIRGIKIAVPREYYFDLVADEVLALLNAAMTGLRDLGATTLDTQAPEMALINGLAQTVMAVEAATIHREWLATRRDDYADVVRSRIEPGLFIPATRYCEALSVRARVAQGYLDTVFAGCDVVLTPAISIPVPTIAETTTDDTAKVGQRIGALTHCTRGINYLGLPVVSLPIGFTQNGMPCALQLVGRPFAEGLLLKVADAYQRFADWHRRVPPTAV